MTRPHSSDQPVIVVAEDDPQVLKLVARVLTDAGYRVVTATDGTRALQAMMDEPADLVLLDVCLGDVSGFDVCRQLKANLRTQLTPVMLLTGCRDESFQLRSIEAGADEFFLKPIDLEILRARVRSLLRAKQLVDELESAESLL